MIVLLCMHVIHSYRPRIRLLIILSTYSVWCRHHR
eukprot:COSAG06_NODE_38270_length_425_cov_0.953988_2_plen_34_part_01